MCHYLQNRVTAVAIACLSALIAAAPTFAQPCPDSGDGVVTVVPDFGNCAEGTAPLGDGPYTWDISEGGSYFITITGVSECNGQAITLFAEASDGSNFCLPAYLTNDPGTYLAEVQLPPELCFTYLLSYKCGDDVECDNVGTFPAQGPGGICIVQLRAAVFSSSEVDCQYLGIDQGCGEGGPESCLLIAPPGGDLGCYPDPNWYACNPAMATVVPQGGCTPGEVVCVPGQPTLLIGENIPCNSWSVINSYSVTCGEASCTEIQEFTWREVAAPVIESCPSGTSDLGCNPAEIPGCDPSVTAHDDCGPVVVNCEVIDQAVGCHHARLLIYTAENCAGIASCTKTYTWTQYSLPVFDNCGPGSTDLGCNPPEVPNCPGNVSAHDECGSVAVDCTVIDSVAGCQRTRTLTYAATNCAGTSTCAKTYTWTQLTAPVFDNCQSGSTDLGANPGSIPDCDSTVTAHDECGPVNVTCASSDQANGCQHTRTLTFTATNCAGTSTCTRVYNWGQGSQLTFDNCESGTTDLGCSPASIPEPNLTITASNGCGPVTVTNDGGVDSGSDCEGRTRTITYSASDAGQTITCTRTYTWTLGTITACKFYDANANGIQDAGESGIGNWPFTVTSNGAFFANGSTNATGCVTFCGVPNGTYAVSEALQGTWQNTTPLTQTVSVDSDNCSATVIFGNVCFVGGGNGFTLGFWSNKNGGKILTENYVNGGGWAAALNSLNLKNVNGTDFVLSTFNSRNDVTTLQSWLLNANATNMASMLSAQLTATTLNTMFKGLSNGSVMRVPGGMNTGANACIVPLTSVAQPITCGAPPLLALTTIPGSTACGCSSNDGLAVVGDIRAKANCLLGAYPTLASAPSGSLQRNYMESVKDLLDVINNNGNPGGSSSYPCGPGAGAIQFVSPTVCAH